MTRFTYLSPICGPVTKNAENKRRSFASFSLFFRWVFGKADNRGQPTANSLNKFKHVNKHRGRHCISLGCLSLSPVSCRSALEQSTSPACVRLPGPTGPAVNRICGKAGLHDKHYQGRVHPCRSLLCSSVMFPRSLQCVSSVITGP